MDITESEWMGYRRLDFLFEEHSSILVFPHNKKVNPDGKWLFKTEYFGAYPDFELAMLERGYYLAHIKGTTRWCPPEDTELRAHFIAFIHNYFGLCDRCMPVGMSCGGMQAVYLASSYPQYIAAMYLDAPVLNLLSCPCGIGKAGNQLYEEFCKARNLTVSDLINFRDHPFDRLPRLVESRIPIALVCGDSDQVVPYEENGKELSDCYRAAGIPFLEVIKPNCDHHPHGLTDPEPLLSFAERYYCLNS